MEILYDNKWYTIRYANHRMRGLIRIGSESLRTALINPKTGKYKGNEEKLIGEGLDGFVEPLILRKYTDDKFDEYINEKFI